MEADSYTLWVLVVALETKKMRQGDVETALWMLMVLWKVLEI